MSSQQSELWLMLMRHGEAEGLSHSKPDFARQLTVEGRQAAFANATTLKNKYFLPQLGFTSEAARACETAEEVARAWGGYQWKWERGLYHAGLPEIAQCVKATLSSHKTPVNSILCVGHNPGWSYAVMHLSNEYVTLSTADLAVLRVQAGGWEEALQMVGCWDLCEVIQDTRW